MARLSMAVQGMLKGQMQIVNKKITEIQGYDRNARTHSAEQVRQIAASIEEFGFCNPILIDEKNIIIAGHGRFAAAQLLKMVDVPCIVLGHLSDAQRRAYVIADNKIALNSGWDTALLQAELADISGIVDLSLLGFCEIELSELLPIEPVGGNTDPDDVPSPEKFVCTVGDVWALGNHRLICGDATLSPRVTGCAAVCAIRVDPLVSRFYWRIYV